MTVIVTIKPDGTQEVSGDPADVIEVVRGLSSAGRVRSRLSVSAEDKDAPHWTRKLGAMHLKLWRILIQSKNGVDARDIADRSGLSTKQIGPLMGSLAKAVRNFTKETDFIFDKKVRIEEKSRITSFCPTDIALKLAVNSEGNEARPTEDQ